MAEIIRMPKLSDTMTEGVVVTWHKKVGDKVKQGELLAEIETDKATMEFESFYAGVLLHIGVERGKTVPVDTILAIIGIEGEDIPKLLEEEKRKSQKPEVRSQKELQQDQKKPEQQKDIVEKGKIDPVPVLQTSNLIKASPLAKKLAKEKGIDPRTLTGSGDGGRVVKRDVENFRKMVFGSGAVSTSKQIENFTESEVSPTRKTIAKRLAESKFSAPHYYLGIEIDMERAMDVRHSINESLGLKISFNDLIIKAAAMTLHRHPKVNASWIMDSSDSSRVKIRYYNYIHVGVAIAIEDGLLVPVVKFADSKTLSEINTEVKLFAEKARNRKLKPEEMQGNTFTVSNLGMMGIDHFTAIINPSDSCIMAVGRIKQIPIVKEGQIVPGNVMKVTLSCDHRIVDGATGAQFLKTFKEMMENPVLFLATAAI